AMCRRLGFRHLRDVVGDDGSVTKLMVISTKDLDTGFAVSLLGAGWSRRVAPAPAALRDALRRGAEEAYRQCFVEAAFGHGWPTPVERTGPGARPAPQPGRSTR
ncbi:hypothetical protein ACWES4_30035, partial [Streptomyces sp. NPDC004011]